MSGTYTVAMGDRGRLVVPAELRERLNLTPGTPLVLFETPAGVVLTTREQLKSLVRERLADRDLVAELLADRRREAAADDGDRSGHDAADH
jgi:AbrB family looped-hinge helix DNA binding protein